MSTSWLGPPTGSGNDPFGGGCKSCVPESRHPRPASRLFGCHEEPPKRRLRTEGVCHSPSTWSTNPPNVCGKSDRSLANGSLSLASIVPLDTGLSEANEYGFFLNVSFIACLETF